MPPKMTHICLHVENLQQRATFYERYCGLSVVKDRTEGGEGSIYMMEQNQEHGIVFQSAFEQLIGLICIQQVASHTTAVGIFKLRMLKLRTEVRPKSPNGRSEYGGARRARYLEWLLMAEGV